MLGGEDRCLSITHVQQIGRENESADLNWWKCMQTGFHLFLIALHQVSRIALRDLGNGVGLTWPPSSSGSFVTLDAGLLTRPSLKPKQAIITLPLHSYTKVKDAWHLCFSRAHRNSCCLVCDSLIHDDIQGWYNQKWKFQHHVFSLMYLESIWFSFFCESQKEVFSWMSKLLFYIQWSGWGLKTPLWKKIYTFLQQTKCLHEIKN